MWKECLSLKTCKSSSAGVWKECLSLKKCKSSLHIPKSGPRTASDLYSGSAHFNSSPVKVKCTLVQALRLCTGRTAHRGSRGIAVLLGKGKVHPCTGRTGHRGSIGTALLFLDHDTRAGWGVSVTPRPLYPDKNPVPIVKEAGWASGSVWTGVENLIPTGIRSPDRPARSQSLYWQR